ncbi:hypothetical protein [Marinobacter sp. ELB17]|uniref:hypothetical protein n=1 Tax=Marinobacter sp. ELB17 TaxID=270374 RepID=UPI0000F39C6C|nr:hypothetical protein [Marinobacter sp. ELB17]EAZ97242.1 hypothetical protein MELB17_10133 [Marinobacter sp. ELB17]
MKIKPLTKTERDWLRKLQNVLNECPSDRLGAYTVGDADLHIYDSRFESEINEILENGKGDFCLAVSDLGAELGFLTTPFPVHSTAG